MEILIRVQTTDKETIEKLDKLKKSRKMSAYIVAALRHFDSSGEGKQMLSDLTGSQT